MKMRVMRVKPLCLLSRRRRIFSRSRFTLLLCLSLCVLGFIKMPLLRELNAHGNNSSKGQASRRSLVEETCRRQKEFDLKPSYLHKYDKIMVDKKRKILFCIIPKAGSAFWRRLFDPVNVHKFRPTNLSTFTPSQRRHILKHYLKVMFVRDPLDRLWSAYNDKFVGMEWRYIRLYGLKIVKRYRKNADETALSCAHNVRFAEFAKYVIDEENSELTHDDHWAPFYQLCQPCDIKYDFIGKLDTFTEDVALFYETSLKSGHFKKEELPSPLASAYKEVRSAACRAPFLKSTPFDKKCLNLSFIIDSRLRSLVGTGLLNISVSPDLKYITSNITSAESWVPFCKRNIKAQKNILENPSKALATILSQKMYNRKIAYDKLSSDVKRGLLSVYGFDMALYNYSSW